MVEIANQILYSCLNVFKYQSMVMFCAYVNKFRVCVQIRIYLNTRILMDGCLSKLAYSKRDQ